jgi:hypothetical protein
VLMARLARAEKIPQLTEGVRELRQARCAFVHAGELSNMAFSMLRCYTILSLRATSRAVLERYRGSYGTVRYRITAARPSNLTVQGQFRWNVGTKLKVCHEYRDQILELLRCERLNRAVIMYLTSRRLFDVTDRNRLQWSGY